MLERLSPPTAPKPHGPYSPGVQAGGFIYVSGQGPIHPASGTLVEGSIEEQTQLALETIAHILTAAGASMRDIVKCSVFLSDVADFAAMNAVYARFFTDGAPARTTVGAALVEPGMKIEIDCVAYVGAGETPLPGRYVY